ncbi:twin-arginine translocation signal domain-containing protein [Natrinema gelatinilyticum]|uniref:twin-arginine translocation signal domain-containing protein n=1 Tax=Natrinema gelatinilyticum TaxID=2961571 RepID=UPI0020C38EEB|nr:twin-arginine translocation signal domain-containing protein [Natrinema gelatinilyticum]
MSDDTGGHERRDGTESEDRRQFLKLAGVTGTAGTAGIVGSNGVLSALAAEGDGDDEGVEIEVLQGQMPIEASRSTLRPRRCSSERRAGR